jgi:Flp pilus assembly protein protease CpaA
MLEISSYNSSLGFISIMILSILFYIGIRSDIQSYEVPNWITSGIIVSSLPLIYFNRLNIGYINLEFLWVFSMASILDGGIADIKAIAPLLFVFPNVVMFAGILAFCGVIQFSMIKLRNRSVPMKDIRVPYFLSIGLTFISMVII